MLAAAQHRRAASEGPSGRGVRQLTLALVAAMGIALAAQAPPAPAPVAFDRARLADEVKAEFLHAWKGYTQYAWGHDELRPVSKTARDWHDVTLLLTPVDALDTMVVMGLGDEATRTADYIATHLSFDSDIWVKNFEITIRLLGGLLSSYQLTGDARLLAKADALGQRLLPAFNSPTGMPYMYVNLKTGATRGNVSNPAEIGTLILEFGTLAKLTAKPAYYDAAKRALVAVYNRRDPQTGLIGETIDVETGAWVKTTSHVGGAIDSYYEYLFKCERLFGDTQCGDMWRASVSAIHRHLADDSAGRLWYGEADMRTGARTATTYGSLHAFFPGLLALAGDVTRARRLQESGGRMWALHGIEPEELDYRAMRATSANYELRPEIIESAYILAQVTGDDAYVRSAAAMFNDLRRYCRTDAGYTVLTDVTTKAKGDLMHSFFLAETLKYLYLAFRPQALDLGAVVFTTEAHPLRRAW